MDELTLNERDPSFVEAPHERLDALRSCDPVHHDREHDRIVLTRAKDVAATLNDRSLSLDPYKARPAAAAARGIRESARAHQPMSQLDDPDHARLRGLVSQAFTAGAVERMRPRVRTLTSALLDGIDATRPFDLVRGFAEPLPLMVMAGLLGIPDEKIDQFKAHVREIVALLAPARDDEELRRWNAATRGLNECFRAMVADRRVVPRDDLVGALVAAEQDGESLTEAEILNTCRLLLVAGNLTTTDLIGNGVVALLRHPAQLDRLVNDPSLWPAAVEEMLRYDSPVLRQHRQALEERWIDGQRVEAGQTITTVLAAANHDPALHADPHGFDVARKGQRHFSFGGGDHFCLGATLARLEAVVGIQALFDRFPGLVLAPGAPLRRKSQPGFSGYEEIWLIGENRLR